jgi:integrase
MPLTDIAITRKAKPGPTPVKLCDSHGLYLLVAPSGLRSWRYNYRHQGKQKTIVIGEYPDLSLLDARNEHARMRKLVKAGTDPMDERRREKLVRPDGDSFCAVFEDWFAKKSPGWTPRHAGRVRERFDNDLLPHIGKLPIAAIDAPLLRGVLDRIYNRGARYLAGRTREYAGAVFRFGISRNLCRHDPAHDLREEYPHKAKHMPAIVDPAGVAELMRAVWDYEGTLQTRQAFRLTALTGLRPGEIRHLEWSDVDHERAEIRISAEKMKMDGAHVVPLSRQAIGVLEEMAPLTGHGRYIFPNYRRPAGDRPMSENALTAALHQLGYKGKHSAHGFRSTFCSLANESGKFSADAIERQLSHGERNSVRAAYLHTEYLPERRRMMQWWADYLDELRTGKPTRGKVVKFPG